MGSPEPPLDRGDAGHPDDPAVSRTISTDAAASDSGERAPADKDVGVGGGGSALPDAALLAMAWNGAEALYIVGGDEWLVEAWNPASEQLWGISAHEAIGRTIDELIDWEPISGPGREVDEIPPHVSVWTERTVDRPRVGSRKGETIVVDLTSTVEREPDGREARYVVTSRDVTRSVILAREMAPLSALATTGGAVRDKRTIAREALEILRRGTGADDGVAALIGPDGYELLAEMNPGRFGPLIEKIDPQRSPLIDALGVPGHVISGDPSIMPLREDVRVTAVSLGLQWMVAVGLQSRDSIGGLLALGWIRNLPEEPPETLVAEAAAHLGAALENARLLEELDARFNAAQAVSARLEALMGMSELPETGDIEALGRSVLERLRSSLGAVAGAVWRLDRDRWSQVAEIDLHPAIVGFHREAAAFSLAMWGGTGDTYAPYLLPFKDGSAAPASIVAATSAGYSARAAFPISRDGRVTMVVVLYFSGPPEDIMVDDRTLGAIGRSVNAAFANQHLRERLETAVATQRGLAEQYEIMFRDSPNAVVRVGGDGRILDINRVALALLGGDAADWIGRSSDVLSTLDPKEWSRLALPGESGGGTYHAPGRRLDGTTFPMVAVVTRLSVDGSESFLIHFRDLTDDQRLQGELMQAQKMEAVGQLVAGVAHELNNPLAAIIGFSQMIEQDDGLPEGLRHDAGLLIQESARTKRIVENLLNFARQRPPESHPTKLRPLVESVLDLQSYETAGEWLAAVVDIPDSIPAVPLDRSQMQQVILNLTQNAIQAIRATGAPGTMWVSAEHVRGPDGSAGVVRLAVADNGPGVAPADRGRLFLPFFTTKEPGHGTGLGLSVSFGIVAAHGGRLSFAERPGGGSIFTVELPIRTESPVPEPDGDHRATATSAPATAAAAAAAASKSRDTTAPGGGASAPLPRVLVLDDEPAIRTYLGRVLQASGLAPTLVATGPEALTAIDVERFDLMICDHRMPGMTGTDVYEAVALRQPDLAAHFVLMSGDVLNPQLHEFAASRSLRVLEKPFDIEMVTTVVREALGTVA